MSNAFRDLLKKVGSGTHTSKNLSREESAQATRMMLEQTATPAQIGAFMIAQRIKRPSIPELAGMLDCYDEMGGRLTVPPADYPAMVLSTPYDGRQRHAPVTPAIALMLAAVGVPAVLHGGDRMPTKMGLPLVDVWRMLGIDWSLLTLEQAQQVFALTAVGFVYIPQHFPEAHQLVPYREQIGKRPTLATVELMWSPCVGTHHVVSSFVHPPTENRTLKTYQMRHTSKFTTVKGLEGSCDLARSRTAIVGLGSSRSDGELVFERLLLQPRDYGFDGADPELNKDFDYILGQTICGELTELTPSVIWNGGFYLWRAGVLPTLSDGLQTAQQLLETRQLEKKRKQLKGAIATVLNSHLSTV